MFGKKKKSYLNKEDKSIDTKQVMPIKKEDEVKEPTSKKLMASASNSFEYDVELYDVWDTTSKRLPIFGANRIIEDNNVYLFNPKTGFKELFPENSEEFKQYTLDTLNILIKNIEKKISQVVSGKKEYSLRDLKKDLRIHNNYKRSLELQGRGSYMILSATGRPMFMFDRVGNVKMPLFKNVDRSLIYTPTEQKTQEVVQLLKENDEKNGEQKRLTLSTYALLLLLVMAVIGTLFIAYKTAGLDAEVITTLAEIGVNFAEGAKDLNSANTIMFNITENIQVKPDLIITPTTNVINGQ